MDLLFMLAQAMFYALAVYVFLVIVPIVLICTSLQKRGCPRCKEKNDGPQHS